MNILLITADQWRGDCLGLLGHPHIQTPNLDRLAESGVTFTRNYANAAPCGPSRACLYTGLYQLNNRVCINGSPLDARFDNIALGARRAGYTPTLFGYTDQSVDPRECEDDDPRLLSYEGILPGFDAHTNMSNQSEIWHQWLVNEGVTEIDKDHTETAFLTNQFLDWQQQQNSNQPWFAHISYVRPHPPFVVPQPYHSMVDPDDIADFPGFHEARTRPQSDHPFTEFVDGILEKSTFIPGTNGLSRDWTLGDFKRMAAIYYGMIAEVDAQMGRIFDQLKADNSFDDTLIVFTSDHGEMLGEHGQLGKFGFDNASYHTPLIIHHPKFPDQFGKKVEAITEAVDIMPTLLAATGVDAIGSIDGNSLLPALENSTLDTERDAAHWEFNFRDHCQAVNEAGYDLSPRQCSLSVLQDEAYKYVHFPAFPPLLFDLTSDPLGLTNVADDPDYQRVRAQYAEKMLSWRAEHLDEYLASIQLTENGPVRLEG